MELKDEPDVSIAELDERAIAQGAEVGIGHANLTRVRTIESAQQVQQRALPDA